MGSGLMAETPATHGFGLACLAQVLLTRGKAEEALRVAGQAHESLELAGQVEDGGQLIRLVYAEALAASGRHAEAHAAIRRARDALLDAARPIQDPGSRQSFLDNVPENARTLALAVEWLGPE